MSSASASTSTSPSAIRNYAASTAAAAAAAKAARNRTALFQKSTRKNESFERFLCNGREAAILDATTSKYIPLSYFVTPVADAATECQRTSRRQAHGLADKMPYESFRLINLQQRGGHAHSLVLFKSRAITTNPEQIAIFECNGQYTQSEIRVIHTRCPTEEYVDSDSSDDGERGTVYDVTELYFSPVSPKVCINYGNDKYNPGYCGIFGMITMTYFKGVTETDTGAADWVKNWTRMLKYMRQSIPDESASHGCRGTNLAAQVQEIIASHPNTPTGHEQVEKEIRHLIKQALRTMKHE
jgi:hypothetical protein